MSEAIKRSGCSRKYNYHAWFIS